MHATVRKIPALPLAIMAKSYTMRAPESHQMIQDGSTRREFLKFTAVGAAGVVMSGCAAVPGPRSAAAKIRLGVATYSLRAFKRAEAIRIVRELNVPYVNIKSFHLPYDGTPEELAAGHREFEEAGLTIVGGGTVKLKKETDDDVRMHFEYAKRCGMPLLVIAPTPRNLPRIEKFVKEYDIQAAIHNHGPEDQYFPGPADALRRIKDMDPRMGVCIDVGHTARTGVDVVESIVESGDRLLDMHMKDLRDLKDKRSQCIIGEGAMPVPAIFRQLKKMKYGGFVNLEYEIQKKNPMPGMKKSFAYMRDVRKRL